MGFERRAMQIIIRLIARYYLKKPGLYALMITKIPTFRAALFSLANEICYVAGSKRSFRVTSLSMEVTNHCNLHCLMCPTVTEMKRPRGFMEEPLFRAIIDKNPSLEYVFLFQWGEPFLHPRLFDFIDYASAKKIRTLVTTNGTIFSGAVIRRILDSGLERLTFSLDGTGATYNGIRGFDYERVKANILELKKQRDLENSGLKIDVSMVVFEKTEPDIARLTEQWRDTADALYLIPRLIKGARDKKCREPWRGNLTVLWDGRVVPCCVDFDARMTVGDAAKEGIADIWNGAPMRRLRQLHHQGSFPGVCGSCGEYGNPCADSRFR